MTRVTDCLTEGFEEADWREVELLKLVVSEVLFSAMKDAGIKQKEIAQILRAPTSTVSRVLSGERNLTIQTMATFAHALGCRLVVSVEPLDAKDAEAGAREEER